MSDQKTAAELVADLKTADKATATAILTEEQAKPEGDQRVTVVNAATARLSDLNIPGEVQASTPSGTWAQLLDGDGEPVLVDGKSVAAELTP